METHKSKKKFKKEYYLEIIRENIRLRKILLSTIKKAEKARNTESLYNLLVVYCLKTKKHLLKSKAMLDKIKSDI